MKTKTWPEIKADLAHSAVTLVLVLVGRMFWGSEFFVWLIVAGAVLWALVNLKIVALILLIMASIKS
jgi:hypothetical protein